MPVEDPGKHPSKRKREKPFVVESRRNGNCRILFPAKNEWRVWGRYHSLEVAQNAMELAQSKYRFYDFRMGDDDGRR